MSAYQPKMTERPAFFAEEAADALRTMPDPGLVDNPDMRWLVCALEGAAGAITNALLEVANAVWALNGNPR